MFSSQPSGKENIIRFLTSGNWEVTKILAYEEETKKIYFLSTEDMPRRRHLYSVDLHGPFNRFCVTCDLLPNCTFVDAEFSPSNSYFILYCKGPRIPQVSVHKTQDPHDFLIIEDNGLLRELLQGKQMPVTEYKAIRLAGYDLPVQLSLPAGYKDAAHPLILMLDDAPESHWVTEEFLLTWDTVLVSSLEVITARFDGRGSKNQGRKLLQEINHKLGSLDVKDHITLIEWLGQLPYIDHRRIGIFGKVNGIFLSFSKGPLLLPPKEALENLAYIENSAASEDPGAAGGSGTVDEVVCIDDIGVFDACLVGIDDDPLFFCDDAEVTIGTENGTDDVICIDGASEKRGGVIDNGIDGAVVHGIKGIGIRDSPDIGNIPGIGSGTSIKDVIGIGCTGIGDVTGKEDVTGIGGIAGIGIVASICSFIACSTASLMNVAKSCDIG
ncbi:inactive dipeptidyl peptidase 10-like [Rhinatrema bivittatum]|uniref:inactive dipeptidyl peptidase 10-like n=1 Tax=Rhinatrema bivittatum TaxID=194408 RepID=UPI00112DA171|nr:inactive dipeptidyl peptidase 10-like [Rhinatrema bivittatum]